MGKTVGRESRLQTGITVSPAGGGSMSFEDPVSGGSVGPRIVRPGNRLAGGGDDLPPEFSFRIDLFSSGDGQGKGDVREVVVPVTD